MERRGRQRKVLGHEWRQQSLALGDLQRRKAAAKTLAVDRRVLRTFACAHACELDDDFELGEPIGAAAPHRYGPDLDARRLGAGNDEEAML